VAHVGVRWQRRPWLALSAVTACAIVANLRTELALAQGRVIEDIQISRTDGQATVAVHLACPMRFLADARLEAGALLEVRVAPFEVCRQLVSAGDIYSELSRPASGHIAHLVELEYESLGLGDSFLHVRFDRPVDYRVSQRADLRTLVLTINLEAAPATTAITLPTAERSSVVPPQTPGPEEREPLTSRVIEPVIRPDYMLNLQSTLEPVDPSVLRSVGAAQGLHLYVSQTTVDNKTWYRLRLGFYGSEEEANVALAGLAQQFPRAWIGRAEPEEIERARELALPAQGHAALPVVAADELPTVTDRGAPGGAEPLDPSGVDASLTQGRAALLAGDFDTAVGLYRQLLQTPGPHRAEAREYLGIAYERGGRPALARAEYESYLREFPVAEGAPRVQQRLNGLVMASAAPRTALRDAEAGDSGHWEITSGVAQYFRRDVNQFDEDQPEITTLSALLTDVDVNVLRRGTRVDLSTRLTLSHMYDLAGEEESGPGDQERISYAHFELASNQQDWSLRLGRQSLHAFGVLGRFDGAHFSYGWAPDRELHATVGFPVESTRHALQTDREFYGVAVELDDVVGHWDVAPYLNTETIEGIDSRMAIGAELRYFDDRRTFTSMLDYDTDYGALNTVLVLATWQFTSRLTLSALVDKRKSPTLTTRNALIGQPVATMEELLLVWTEEEVRSLAMDRTADADTITLGIARPLAERFQLNFDVTSTEIGPTIASGGVPEIPGTGAQVFYSASLVGTGLFSSGDVSIINLRYGESDEFKTGYLTLDARFVIGQRVRINPRLRLAVWESLIDGRSKETVSPALRFLMNTRNHYRVELEIGSVEDMRRDIRGTSDASGRFVNFGYRANF
jgi:tetratricopeptide (TPR) repeat protein